MLNFARKCSSIGQLPPKQVAWCPLAPAIGVCGVSCDLTVTARRSGRLEYDKSCPVEKDRLRPDWSVARKWPQNIPLKRQNHVGFSARHVRRIPAAKEFRADCQTAHSKGSWPSSNSGSNMSLMAT